MQDVGVIPARFHFIAGELLRLRGARFPGKDYGGSHRETNAQNESRENEQLHIREVSGIWESILISLGTCAFCSTCTHMGTRAVLRGTRMHLYVGSSGRWVARAGGLQVVERRGDN